VPRYSGKKEEWNLWREKRGRIGDGGKISGENVASNPEWFFGGKISKENAANNREFFGGKISKENVANSLKCFSGGKNQKKTRKIIPNGFLARKF
jgi:hypothetical protein